MRILGNSLPPANSKLRSLIVPGPIGARLFWALDVVFSFDEEPCMRPPSRKHVIGGLPRTPFRTNVRLTDDPLRARICLRRTAFGHY